MLQYIPPALAHRLRRKLRSCCALLLLTAVVGCGPSGSTLVDNRTPIKTGPRIDSVELRELTAEFLSEAAERGIGDGHYMEMTDITQLPSLDIAQTLGKCYRSASSSWIEILDSLGGDYLRTIMWHELGHCVYRMPHTAASGQIMSAAIGGGEYESSLEDFWDSVPSEYRINNVTMGERQ